MLKERGYVAHVKHIGKKHYRVSTVAMPPKYEMFETAIFESDLGGYVENWNPVYERRYGDAQEAEKAHMEILNMGFDDFGKLLGGENEI